MDGLKLEAQGLSVRLGAKIVVEAVDFGLPENTVTTLLGPNGAGKTTLLKACAGLLPASGGKVLVDGTNLAERSPRRRARLLAYLPQSHRPVFPFSVAEIVLMGRWSHASALGGYGRGDRRAAERAIELVGIEALAGRPYTQLSGGERQLVLLARAVAQDASVLILDEPESGLDFGHRQGLMILLRRLAAEGRSILLSSHFPENALWFADQAVLLAHGRVVASGPPEETVTANALHGLYGVALRLERTAGGRAVCVPEALI